MHDCIIKPHQKQIANKGFVTKNIGPFLHIRQISRSLPGTCLTQNTNWPIYANRLGVLIVRRGMCVTREHKYILFILYKGKTKE